jgi:DNA-binding MarR family transcriptional regulator
MQLHLCVYSQHLHVARVVCRLKTVNPRPRPTPQRVAGGTVEKRAGDVSAEELEAVLAASRSLVAISAQSIAAQDLVDVTQFRALVIVASHNGVSLGELADAARLHLSTASRLCDRLVSMGLLNRADDPANRRQLTLTLTAEGGAVVRNVMQHRRDALRPILARMPAASRAQLAALLQEFTAASGEPPAPDVWAMGWTT